MKNNSGNLGKFNPLRKREFVEASHGPQNQLIFFYKYIIVNYIYKRRKIWISFFLTKLVFNNVPLLGS
jgi:hypothetical protein